MIDWLPLIWPPVCEESLYDRIHIPVAALGICDWGAMLVAEKLEGGILQFFINATPLTRATTVYL